MLDKVTEVWAGQPSFILCGGPSLSDWDLSAFGRLNTIAVNSSWQAAPQVDYLFFGDSRWWVVNSEEVLATFKGSIITTSTVKHERVKVLNKVAPERVGITPLKNSVAMRRTSTLAAINLAVHFGSDKIILVGCDGKAINGKTHHHKPHKWPQKDGCWDEQRKDFTAAVKPLEEMGVKVINASPESSHQMWPRMPLPEAMKEFGL